MSWISLVGSESAFPVPWIFTSFHSSTAQFIYPLSFSLHTLNFPFTTCTIPPFLSPFAPPEKREKKEKSHHFPLSSPKTKMCITHLFAHPACNHTTPNLPLSLVSHCAALDAALRFYHTQPDRPPLRGGMVMPRVCGLEESTANEALSSNSRPMHPGLAPPPTRPYIGEVRICPVPWGCGRAEHGACRTGWGTWWCPWVRGETARESARISSQMGNAGEGSGGNEYLPGRRGDANQPAGYPGSGRAPWSEYGPAGGSWTGGDDSGSGTWAEDSVAERMGDQTEGRARGMGRARGYRDRDQGGREGRPGARNDGGRESRPVPESRSAALNRGGHEDASRAGNPGFLPTPVISSMPLFSPSRTALSPTLRSSPTIAVGNSSTPLSPKKPPHQSRTTDDAEPEFWGWGLWIDNATGEIARWSAEPESTGGLNEGVVGSVGSTKRGTGKEREGDQSNDKDEGTEYIKNVPTHESSKKNKRHLTHDLTPKTYHLSTVAGFRAQTLSSVVTPESPRYSGIENVRTQTETETEMGGVGGGRVSQDIVRIIYPGRCIVDGGC